jgi:hypothetical protein
MDALRDNGEISDAVEAELRKAIPSPHKEMKQYKLPGGTTGTKPFIHVPPR